MIKKLLFVSILTGFASFANAQRPARRAPVAGSRQIPKWKIEDVVSSFSGNNDTVYVVNFWATFCKPCNEEIPDFIRLAEKYKKQKVKLLLVSLDLPSYLPVRLPEFIKKNKYNTNHVWLNETDADRFCPMIDARWSGAIPATIMVNNKNGFRKFFDDQISAGDFEASLKAAIGGTVMKKYLSPMNEVKITDNESTRGIADAAPMDYITFKSNDSSVYSIMGGTVTSVIHIEDMRVVIIQNEKMFYTYSNLGSTKIKTGDIVKPNQLIGFAAKDLDGDKPTLELYVNDEQGKTVTLSKNDFIARNYKRLIDHSVDLFKEPQ